MRNTLKNKVWSGSWAALLVLALILAGCASPQGMVVTGEQAAAQDSAPDVTFRLQTGESDGKLVYLGTEGELEGQVNPDLLVNPGDVVEIILVNSEGGQGHNLVIDGYNKATGMVSRKGQETRVVFTAEQEGIFPYYSSAFQHREGGMAGRLVVGEAAARQAAASRPAQAGASTGQSEAAGEVPTISQANVSYTLVTGMQDGRMVFIGSGGDLEGQVNPDLTAQLGDVVEIVLVNGDAIQHNVAFEGLDAKSEYVDAQGEETRLSFTAGQEGTFVYFCDVPGHRQAGMEGKFIVGEPAAAEQPVDIASVSLSPDTLPGPITRTEPERVRVDLETTEVEARLADGSTYTFWTFNGSVPGPLLRVRVGDTLEVHLKNAPGSKFPHSVDFHAATGPGGGAAATQTQPGSETMVTLKMLNPGVYVYHCATPSVAQHISNGMYGLIVVEPEGGLPPVDREFYVMQGELYTAEDFGHKGAHTFSYEKMLDETPEYFFFNGAVGALTAEHPLHAEVGETVRIYFGVGGPNFISSFHIIGEIFDRVYNLGSLTAPPLIDVQSVVVPTGGSTVVEFKLDVPGRYVLVDHSLSRAERGLVGHLNVEGPPNPEIYDGVVAEGGGH